MKRSETRNKAKSRWSDRNEIPKRNEGASRANNQDSEVGDNGVKPTTGLSGKQFQDSEIADGWSETKRFLRRAKLEYVRGETTTAERRSDSPERE